MKHRLDPIHLHHAATQLGTIVARDDMSDADASDTIKAWVSNVTTVDRSGLQARLHHAMRDQARAHRLKLANAETAIKWAVRPLIEAAALKHEIEEAASNANGGVLSWDEIVPILRNEWNALHGRRRRG
jgi:hypothetical protein